jgi:uncharacterized protein (DUF1501 family)
MPATGFVNGNPDHQRSIVVVFLRGGADGLQMVAPVGDDDYYRARPKIAVAQKNAHRLDGFFALHPSLEALHRPYLDGDLAIIHGAGSEDDTRSHFEAQDMMEHGGAAGGWLGRFLRMRPDAGGAPLAAVAIGKTLPESLRGGPSTVVMESLESLAFPDESQRYLGALGELYALEQGPIGDAGRDTMNALERIRSLHGGGPAPANGAAYPENTFGDGMRVIGQLIKAKVGLEAATIDLDGWDSHIATGPLMEPRMQVLADSLAALRTDLGPAMKNTTVVVMTEFGRRVYENASYGTDHGRASAMFVMGGGIAGGQVHAEWGGLASDKLVGPGDLPVVFNYRDVLAPILNRTSPATDVADLFPHHAIRPVPMFS